MWQPAATQSYLEKRAKLLANCRSFFSQRDVMEVEVPVIGRCGVSDPNIECISTEAGVLQSSPEYFMKRLLAAGSGDIYYLGKAFRKEEGGSKHSAEFTMLEWYRLGMDDQQLVCELLDLLAFVSGKAVSCVHLSYAEVFCNATGLNPHIADTAKLESCARARLGVQFDLPDKSAWLDLLFSHCVEPTFENELIVIYDFPACQAALARKKSDLRGYDIAKRFEVYWKGLELANGYWELSDPIEQKQRIDKDLISRKEQGRPAVEIDELFLAALEAGLPSCSGVALGIDRLLMCLTGAENIARVQAFPSLG